MLLELQLLAIFWLLGITKKIFSTFSMFVSSEFILNVAG